MESKATKLLFFSCALTCTVAPTDFDLYANMDPDAEQQEAIAFRYDDQFTWFVPPTFTDEEYRERVIALKAATSINFRYDNRVRNFIESYTVNHRNTAERVLGYSTIYFPTFEAALQKYGLPEELKYLPIIESALNAKAYSKVGAAGLWQFIPSTGKMMGLKITSDVDERLDPELASDAAARYLKKLHGRFGDWMLAIAAYNCGPGRVNSCIKKAGSRDIWDIYPYLPRETRGYVPSFIGAAYLMDYYHLHHLNPLYPEVAFQHTEQAIIYNKTTFEEISERSGVPMYQIDFLNPAFKKKRIPDNYAGYTLTLPSAGMMAFRGDYSATPAIAMATTPPEVIQNAYVPEPAVIATLTPVKSEPVRRARRVKYQEKPIGQRDKIKVTLENNTEKDVVLYEVQRGDNLWDIAKKFPGVTTDDIIRLNKISNYRTIRPGAQLIIGS